MLLDQETLRFIFGLKLRALRLDKGLSLKELSRSTGLSPSYLNEIEKGKKYPKTEKILLLARALGEKHEDLISLELSKDLQLVQTLLDRKFLTGIPFDVFGIPAGMIFELAAERPEQIRALVGTLLEVARGHNIGVDDLFFALLRSYIDMHGNHFPEIENVARDFRARHPLPATLPDLKARLVGILRELHGTDVVEADFAAISPDLAGVVSFVTDHGRRVHLAAGLDEREAIFILMREVGYRALRLRARPVSSLILQLDSFDQLLNHFQASYFASAVLMPEGDITADCRALFARADWDPAAFRELLDRYPCSMESVFHRLTQVLSHGFGVRNLFFLRYEYDRLADKYEIARELHLSSLHGPHRVQGNEHYCGRWLIQKITQEHGLLPKGSPAVLGLQRSRYARTENEYLIVGAAYAGPQAPRIVTSVCIGLLMSDETRRTVRWADALEIARVAVGETCERCPIPDCEVRKAPLDPQRDPGRYDRVFQTIATVSRTQEASVSPST